MSGFLAAQSTGSGVGDSSTWGLLNSDSDTTTWTTGKNATFLGSGTLGGTFVKQSATSPLSGKKSYLYTQGSSSLNDWVASGVIPVPLRAKNSSTTATNLLRITYTYNGSDNDVQLVVWDVTNSAKLTSLSQTFKSNANPYQKNEFLFELPSSCTQVKVGVHVLVANSGKVLKFDDIELTDKPFGMVSTIEQESVYLNNVAAGAVSTFVGFGGVETSLSNFSNVLAYESLGTATRIKVLKKCQITLNAGLLNNGTSQHFPSFYRNGAILSYGSQSTNLNLAAINSISLKAEAGDYFQLYNQQSGNTAGYGFFSATAIASRDNVIQSYQDGSVGEIKYLPQNVAPNGFIPCQGQSIGNTSGTYQGSNYFQLYTILWQVAQTTAGEPYVISSTKGTDALTDWNANKTITMDESGLFTRAYKSGTSGAVGAKQLDAFQGHYHNSNYSVSGAVGSAVNTVAAYPSGSIANTGGPITDGTNGTPRTSSETRPTNVAKYPFIRFSSSPSLIALPVSKDNNKTYDRTHCSITTDAPSPTYHLTSLRPYRTISKTTGLPSWFLKANVLIQSSGMVAGTQYAINFPNTNFLTATGISTGSQPVDTNLAGTQVFYTPKTGSSLNWITLEFDAPLSSKPTWADEWVEPGVFVAGGIALDWQYDISSQLTGFASVNRARARVIKTGDGAYLVDLRIRGAVTSSSRSQFVLTIAGLTFAEETPLAYGSNTGLSSVNCVANGSAGTITIDHSSITTTRYDFAGTVEVTTRPTWAVNTI